MKSLLCALLLAAIPIWEAYAYDTEHYAQGPREVVTLTEGWHFIKGDPDGAALPAFDDSGWDKVTIPHDWAIYGPFDRSNDLQELAVTQNFETIATIKTGRTGGLPYVGTGWYRNHFSTPEGKNVTLLFDGAMSEANVYVNGRKAVFWPNGYNSFYCDVTSLLNPAGEDNVLAVRLENRPFSSRWYPGAGLYRNVHLVLTGKVHVPVWGTYVTTPFVKDDYAVVRLLANIEGADSAELRLDTEIKDASGRIVASKSSVSKLDITGRIEQNIILPHPALWSPESPSLYTAETKVYTGDKLADVYSTVFGVRTIEYIPDEGFFLNGKRRQFQGVCNHHDLGPLGAAVNESALRHQLLILKDMGCDAIRTSHNMPAPELVRLCDEMGFMIMVESFDEWDVAKCQNGYHRFFAEWAEKDMVNMIRQFRNNPSVIMWSIGNEVPTQCEADGARVASFLQDICHREDPTRPVTCGMDQVSCVLENGMAAIMDIPGLNYRTFRYEEAYKKLPQGFILGSETGSTVSSRGVYKIPAEKRFGAKYPDHHSSAYEMEACGWSNIPDIDFSLADDYQWSIGQFVWTGFDYLGEPTPYDTDSWPNHSSMFGIIDLASLPKDRFYLFRSVWNRNEPTLHVLPHWNWKEGQEIPVHVFTSYPEAELFVNGVSYGRRHKEMPPRDALGNVIDSTRLSKGGQKDNLEPRYRLIWDNVIFKPGELKVVAYDAQGNIAGECVRHTAGKPHHIVLEASYPEKLVGNVDNSGKAASGKESAALIPEIRANGKDLLYVTAKVVDKNGNVCPTDNRLMSFKVSGAATYRASANGDPTCLDLFHEPQMHAFSGMLTVIVQASDASGDAVLEVKAKGLSPVRFHLKVK